MQFRHIRTVAALLVGLIALPLAGCGGQRINAESRYNGTPYNPPPAQPNRTGLPNLTTKQKVLLLAGAAAVYYLYKKHQNRQGEGPDGRYFLSKNGRVYYRDMKTGQFHWVDPPSQPIRVPAEDYERYTGRRVDAFDGGVIREAPEGWNRLPAGTGAYR
jgi:hypothetical protein